MAFLDETLKLIILPCNLHLTSQTYIFQSSHTSDTSLIWMTFNIFSTIYFQAVM